MLKTEFHPIAWLFVLLWLSCGQENGKPVEITHNYGTGEISRRYFELNGKIEGEMIEYYPNGSIKSTGTFVENKQEGRRVFYYPDGNVKEAQYYSGGLKHGPDTIWHENGHPHIVMNFNQGKKDGYLFSWSPDGELVYEAKYQNDTLVEVKGEKIQVQSGEK